MSHLGGSNLHARLRPRRKITHGDDLLQGEKPKQSAEEAPCLQHFPWAAIAYRLKNQSVSERRSEMRSEVANGK